VITDITDPYMLENLYGYKLKDESPLKNRGLDLVSIFGIEQPGKDFYGNSLSQGDGNEPGIYKMK
jgi:hypothetical protein